MIQDRRSWAWDRLQSAEEDEEYGRQALKAGRYARAVAFAADSIDGSLKAILFALGIDPAEEHHTAPGELHAHRHRLPREFRDASLVWIETGKIGVRHRNIARYGNTKLGRTRSQVEAFRDPHLAEDLLGRALQLRIQATDYVRAVWKANDLRRE